MLCYVAFLDILGFKGLLKSYSQRKAKNFIAVFSSVIYSVFRRYNPDVVNGFIVSDSLVLHTNECNENAFKEIVNLITEICQREFSENSILLRGSITKGEFDRMPAVDLPKLQKQLIVGQAYVDAYNLESSTKTIGIILSEEVYEDLREYGFAIDLLQETIDKQPLYLMRYLSIDFLMDFENIKRFIDLASQSNWLPHYYNAIYISLNGEKNSKKVFQLFDNIIMILSQKSNDWRLVDCFIKNAFQDNVYPRFKQRFSNYLRKRVIKSIEYDDILKKPVEFVADFQESNRILC